MIKRTALKSIALLICCLVIQGAYAQDPSAREGGKAQPSDYYFIYKGALNNFTIDSQSFFNKKYYTYNYNRFRNDMEWGWENKLTFKVIWDLESYWGESLLRNPDFVRMDNVNFQMPLNPYHDIVSGNTTTLRSYLYRAYSTITLPASSLVLGFQRIPLGVGRIWNPTDILNPPNPISLETGERLGVYGANYSYNIGDLSQLHTFLTLNEDNQTKDYGFRFKGNYYGYDAAISTIRNANGRMSGLELERELFSTGVEVRLEAANFEDIRKNSDGRDYQKYILGADCAFALPNTWYVTMEYLFNENGENNKYDYDLMNLVASETTWDGLGRRYLGLLASYELTPLISLSASEITNLDDGSYFLSPGLRWNLSDNTDMSIGASFFCGSQYSEFWYFKDFYYLNFNTYF